MPNLKVLENFGFRGATVFPGEEIVWDPDIDGDTLQSFIDGGLAELATTGGGSAAAPNEITNAAKVVPQASSPGLTLVKGGEGDVTNDPA